MLNSKENELPAQGARLAYPMPAALVNEVVLELLDHYARTINCPDQLEREKSYLRRARNFAYERVSQEEDSLGTRVEYVRPLGHPRLRVHFVDPAIGLDAESKEGLRACISELANDFAREDQLQEQAARESRRVQRPDAQRWSR